MKQTVEDIQDPPTQEGTEEHSEWSWRSAISALLKARISFGQIAVFALCVLLGFGLVGQFKHRQADPYAGMRQADLVQLLDQMTQRSQDLERRSYELQDELDALESSASSQEAAAQAAQKRRETAQILAGSVPVRGPGLTLTIDDQDSALTVETMVNVLGEFRNAGAEAMEINGKRLNMSTWFGGGKNKPIEIDSQPVTPPYIWKAIGDSHTMNIALGIPGGALAQLRTAGTVVDVELHEVVEINSIKEQ
ncbi:MAG: DUF881 domain-containing protein [Actinomycetaceae bacterium]|nr:DUF881 domain-containing protein [Actinomycetaceae bacterium]